MKKPILSILLLSVLINFTYGGGYTCHRFKVFIETDNDSLIGFVEFGDSYRNYNDSELLKYVKERYKHPYDTLRVYDTIYSLKYPKMGNYELTAVLDEDINKISVDKIRNIKPISKSPCQDWIVNRDTNNYEYYYAWVGHTMLIAELTKKEIDLLNSEPIYESSFGIPFFEYSEYMIVSYSDSITADEIEDIIKQYKANAKDYDDIRTKSKFLMKQYKILKAKFRNENIIIIEIGYTG